MGGKNPTMPFTAIRLDNGHTLVGCTLGNLVVEFDAMGKETWRVSNDDLPGQPINDACGVQRLPNGHTVIASHHAGAHQNKLTEVTPAKAVVWKYTDDLPDSIHHFQILDTDGKPIANWQYGELASMFLSFPRALRPSRAETPGLALAACLARRPRSWRAAGNAEV